jgi:hypothetical protein
MHLLDGSTKDNVLKKIAQLNTALHINAWLRSPGLQPPNIDCHWLSSGCV